MTREQLIELVRRIIAVDGTEQEIDRMLDTFEEHVPYPGASDLIYWEEGDLTPEAIVDRALAYKPVPLPPSTIGDA